jgi:hypothetical protein
LNCRQGLACSQRGGSGNIFWLSKVASGEGSIRRGWRAPEAYRPKGWRLPTLGGYGGLEHRGVGSVGRALECVVSWRWKGVGRALEAIFWRWKGVGSLELCITKCFLPACVGAKLGVHALALEFHTACRADRCRPSRLSLGAPFALHCVFGVALRLYPLVPFGPAWGA